MVVVDPLYDVSDLLGELSYREVSMMPIGSVPFDVAGFLVENRVSLVMTAHDASLIGALFLLAAESVRIPSIFIPHAGLSSAPRSRRIALKTTLFNARIGLSTYLPRYARSRCFLRAATIWSRKFFSHRYIERVWTTACVHGPSSKEMFMRNGVPENAIVVTGQPRYDALVALDLRGKKALLFERLGLSKDKPLALLATQPLVEHGLWSEERRKDFVTLVFGAVHKAGCQLLVKLHPREQSAAAYRSLLSDLAHEHVAIVQDEIHTPTLLASSDLVITLHSTLGLEAMLMGVPVIVADVYRDKSRDQQDEMDYVKSGAAIGVYDPKELAAAIKAVLYDKEVRDKLAEFSKKYVYDYAYLQDGRASARVVEVINALAHRETAPVVCRSNS
jgi:glycosyltransferase involved in cell wall biosynthesis